ncbi:glycogen debranching protein GlgX [Cyanobium sp. HWJ4-Hawea]|uniref:glycogen debranching protein GlgX n=1 Tax=Cyanobium sp. HWJ4-Hawea TaxID=2823713 RepID=UPI0020CC425C|nr:glycogen debranching protein GlgX [Cyanobium sp. HWJ4-Hawea]MCP9808752.1 glycogen debranching protein GlgX [Cyanobium sp. HWJ4-Hawea]
MQLERIDSLPTDEISGLRVRPGKPLPFGVSHAPNGLNFSIYTSAGTACTLVLFRRGEEQPFAELPFPAYYRIGDVFCMVVFDLDYEGIEYGFRIDGPQDPVAGHRFDASKVLMDPYARSISGRDQWGEAPNWQALYPYRACVSLDDFDWEAERPLEIPSQDLVVYEAHVRAYTQSVSSGVKHPGTYAGLVEKIPYLKDLGVNAIELMPIYEFDEFENSRLHPDTGERLYNFWGYSTVGFFAPKANFAATGRFGMQVDEFKQLVKSFHRAGIEVILDVVFNHTAEGNEHGPTLSFKGLDNKTYYMLTPEGYYFNFSGTGNTLNCNNPIVRNLVLDCLRYWAAEYHIDGFRFDLATILGRDPWGAPLANPPLLESLAFDPILSSCKLIAEAWDAGGLYQVGTFPAFGRWGEWNGKYRDCLRRYLKGDGAQVGQLAQRVQGSPDLYQPSGRSPATSVNFITCHDGFTLADLVSYNDKHNEANGEGNRDGGDDNYSWNCGAEGWTDNPGIQALRLRQSMNAMVMLLTSRGTPMLLMGDEFGRSQHGNNNAYCLDSAISWVDWTLLQENAQLHDFVRGLIHFRHAHQALRVNRFDAPPSNLFPDCSFHGVNAWQPDWSADSRQLAWMFSTNSDSQPASGDTVDVDTDDVDTVYVASNMAHYASWFSFPDLPAGLRWHLCFNTGNGDQPFDLSQPAQGDGGILVGDRSVLVLTAKPV